MFVILAAFIVLGGCGGERETAPATPAAVSFQASDGVTLEGRLFGSGNVGIVLSHMGDPADNQTQWWPTARRLSERGYRVLTYNTRGICPRGPAGCSEGEYDLSRNWSDIVGAYRHLESEGVERIVLMGASVGSMGSLIAATKAGVRPSAIIAVSGVTACCGYRMTRGIIRRVAAPTLFLAGTEDYDAAAAARLFFRWAREPKQLVLVDSYAHGTQLFEADPPAGELARQAVGDFLGEHAPLDASGTR